MHSQNYDVIIIGAGAAGMMCGARAGQQGRSVLILDKAKSAGEKIRISGGGRCNFTNLHCGPENFLSQNPHFCKSALAGYSPQDFIDLVETHNIAWHEKTLGQLFCDERAGQIIDMLLAECTDAQNEIQLQKEILDVQHQNQQFLVKTTNREYSCRSLVMACGGPSIPKMGASQFGYQIARQFGLKIVQPRPALVPLCFETDLQEQFSDLSGLSLDVEVSHGKTRFREAMLFTHRGLSGPAILQISSYWQPGQTIQVDMKPDRDVLGALQAARRASPKQSPAGFLAGLLPSRLAKTLASGVPAVRLADMSDTALQELTCAVKAWRVQPASSEGFKKAEVTLGGVSTNELSSTTMQAKSVPGLYFIGEVVDVTGHLGGHNFQWAWASAIACGNALSHS
ncbi:MAG: aminoacetone oxidase family FAD-binding enzyme [Robiginitomaculum sp.]|nr:MAG: aminoacetone oxidase family FAD-binding enzyme [Robiginitomaculum sp.]